MSNPKVILLQGQFKFSPKLTNQQVNDNKKYHHYTDFDLSIDTITCNSFLKIFQNEDIAFKDLKYIIQTFRGHKFRYHGMILGLLEENNKFKKVKFFIKNGVVKHEDCQFRLVKQGTPRGPYNKKQSTAPPPSPPPQNSKYVPRLSQSSFDTLDDNTEVDDAIILAYVNHHLNQQTDNRKIAFETNYIVECLRQKRFKDILQWQDFKGKKLDYYDYIMFPIHRGKQNIGGHWLLCIIDMRKAEIKIYDSMQAGYQYNVYAKLIKDFLNYAGITKEFKTTYLKGPKQATGTVDCGVFVSEYAKRFILNERQSFTQKNIHQIRINMKNLLKPYIYVSKPKPKK